MKYKVLRPIPGTGYGIGEEATFEKEQAELFAEYLIEGVYVESVEEKTEKPEKPAKSKQK